MEGKVTFASGPEGETWGFVSMGRALQKGSTENPDTEAGEWTSCWQMGNHSVARTEEEVAEGRRHKLSIAVQNIPCHASSREETRGNFHVRKAALAMEK